MLEDVDWSQRRTYMYARHGVTIRVANEAIDDRERIVIRPDYASRSGRSIRVIGYSQLLETLVTVILVEHEGAMYGANGWRSDKRDARIYRGAEGGHDE